MFWKKTFTKQSAELDRFANDLQMYVSPFSEGNIIHLLNWLTTFIVAFGQLNIEEATACILLPRFLHGTAKLRWSGISNRSKKHLRKTIESLLESFHSNIDWLLAGDELSNISQGPSTIAEYSLRIEMIGCIAYKHFHKSCREKLLVSHFLRNCNRQLKSKLLALSPIPLTLKGLVTKAEEIEMRLLNNDEMPLIAAIGDVTEEFEKNDRCFFHKQRKSNFEKTERSVESEVSVNCSTTFYELEDVKELGLQQLYEAPSEVALLIFRGSGMEYSSDMFWTGRKVCSKHLDELLLSWHETKFKHSHRRRSRTSFRSSPVCSVPDNFGPEHQRLVRPKQRKNNDFLTYFEAKHVLEKQGVLLHPGIPLCPLHKSHVHQLLLDDEVIGLNEDVENEEREEYTKNPSLPPAIPRSHKNQNSPLEQAVYELGKLVGVTRIKSSYPFQMLSKQSQEKKAKSVRIIMDAIIEIIAPGSEDSLRQIVFRSSLCIEKKDDYKLHNLLTFIAQEYLYANNRQERNIILSLVAKVLPFSHISKYIPGISFYIYDQARKVVQYTEFSRKRQRVRYDSKSVNLFLQFITSNLVMSPFTYGTKKATLTDGTHMELPNTVRKQIHAQIVTMFKTWVKEQNIDDEVTLSDSTCFRILHYCAATPLKSATCVDYFLAQALESRDELNSLFDLWGKDGEIADDTKLSMQKQLESVIHYLRSDYRIHVRTESRVADHCCFHALSDSIDPLLSTDCSHNHDMICEQCELGKTFAVSVETTVREIHKRLVFMSTRKDVEAIRKLPIYRDHERIVTRCLSHIESLKMHVLRSSYTDDERSKIINELEDNEAMLTLDFAQKLLVQKHYETQKNYYGKRGMSYHITHVFAKLEGHLATHSIVHILRGDLQDTLAVTAMLEHALTELKKMGIKTVTLRSDNAANYHCNQTISSLFSIGDATGVQIKRYAFSEAQNGKSSCDRVASVIKRKIRTFVDEGNDVETVEDFMNALKEKPIPYTSVFLAAVKRLNPSEKSEIKNISSIHDIHISKKELIARRYNGIGNGIPISRKKLVPNKSKLEIEDHSKLCASEKLSMHDRKCLKKAEAAMYWHCMQDDKATSIQDVKQTKKQKVMHDMTTVYFLCPEAGCIKEYRQVSSLENHIVIGEHVYSPESVSLRDTVIRSYYDLTNDIKQNCLPKAVTDAIQPIIHGKKNDTASVKRGWALATRKPAKRFNKKQKDFLLELFQTGEATKAKFDGVRAERLMRTKADNNGDPYFQLDELLDFAQINSYFSRLATKKKLDDNSSIKKKRATIQKKSTIRKKKVVVESDIDEDEESENDESSDDDQNSQEFSMIGFKDAKFPDLLTAAQDIIRDNSSELFESDQ